MIWALLALLGIPLWFIAVVLLAVFRNRRSVHRDPNTYAVKIKTDRGWARATASAEWVSDVLIVRRGLAYFNVSATQVSDIVNLGTLDPPPRGLGVWATELEITYQNGVTLSVAVSAENLDRALGPTSAKAPD